MTNPVKEAHSRLEIMKAEELLIAQQATEERCRGLICCYASGHNYAGATTRAREIGEELTNNA